MPAAWNLLAEGEKRWARANLKVQFSHSCVPKYRKFPEGVMMVFSQVANPFLKVPLWIFCWLAFTSQGLSFFEVTKFSFVVARRWQWQKKVEIHHWTSFLAQCGGGCQSFTANSNFGSVSSDKLGPNGSQGWVSNSWFCRITVDLTSNTKVVQIRGACRLGSSFLRYLWAELRRYRPARTGLQQFENPNRTIPWSTNISVSRINPAWSEILRIFEFEVTFNVTRWRNDVDTKICRTVQSVVQVWIRVKSNRTEI